MSPTSDERREVAARLRDEAGGFRRLKKEWGHEPTIDLGDVPAVFQDVAHFAGLDGTVRTCVLFDRLADLIDPTCEVKDDNRLTSDTCDTGVAARRDTPASLADELEAWCDRVDVDGDACDKPRDLAKRIRRLADKEGEQ